VQLTLREINAIFSRAREKRIKSRPAAKKVLLFRGAAILMAGRDLILTSQADQKVDNGDPHTMTKLSQRW
jgi:hypothetical protein